MALTPKSRWLHVIVQVLGLLSTAEAVTLAQFQAVSSNQVPQACLSVYTSMIAGCVQNDFTANAACTVRCAQGLKAKEAEIQESCANVQINPKSLIGIALDGGLLKLLCPRPLSTSIPGFMTIPFPTTTTTTPTPSPPPPLPTTMITTASPTDPGLTITTPVSTSLPDQPSETSVIPSPPSSADPSTTNQSSSSSTTVPVPTSTTTPDISPPSSDPGTPAGPVEPPSTDTAVPQPIEQNGSPFANINLPSLAGQPSSCTPPAPWSMALGAVLVGIMSSAL